MKLLELEVENFGIFSSLQLQLCPGMQVVLGENEAGKSTLLQLIRELLFGFPHQSAYALPHHRGKMAASALAELADGSAVRFTRRKGSKNTVVGRREPGGQAVDEAELSRLMSHASAELYQHVFGFSLSELSAGEKSLAHANLSEALYGGGMGGLATVQRLQNALKEEREELYVARGKNRVINELLQRLHQQDEQLRHAMFKPRDFQQLERDFADSQQQVEQLRQALEQLRRRQAHCRRLSEALAPWLQRCDASTELQTLEVPPDFPPAAADEYARCRETLDHVDADLSEAASELEAVVDALSRIALSPGLLEREAEIKHLEQQIGRIQAVCHDLPQRQEAAASSRTTLLAKLAELNPEWGLEKLDQFRSSLAQRESFEAMRTTWDQLERKKAELCAQRPALLADIATAQNRLAELQTMETLPLLEELIERHAQYEVDQKAVRDIQQHLQCVSAELQTLRTRLDAPLSQGLSNAEKLPVPMEPTVIEFRQQFADMHKTIARHEQRVESVRAELASQQQLLADLEAGQQIPSREELLGQRARRDQGWQLIRQKYIRGKADPEKITHYLAGGRATLADAFQQDVALADQLADKLQVDAQRVARREQLAAGIDRLQQRLDLAEQQLCKCQQAERDLTHDWQRLWSACRLQPLSPDAMRDWLHLHGELIDKLEEQSTLEVQRRDTEARVGDFEDELRELLPNVTGSPHRRLRRGAPPRRTGSTGGSATADLPVATAAENRAAPASGRRTERSDPATRFLAAAVAGALDRDRLPGPVGCAPGDEDPQRRGPGPPGAHPVAGPGAADR